MSEEIKALTKELQTTHKILFSLLERLDSLDYQARRTKLASRVQALIIAALLVLGALFAADQKQQRHDVCVASNASRVEIKSAILDTLLIVKERSPSPEAYNEIVDQITQTLDSTINQREC